MNQTAKYILIIVLNSIFTHCLTGQTQGLAIEFRLGLSDNIFTNNRLTSVEFRPSIYSEFNISKQFQKTESWNFILGAGLIYSGTNLYQEKFEFGETTYSEINENMNMIYGELIFGIEILSNKKIGFEFLIKPSLNLFKSKHFADKPGGLFEIKKSNVFNDLGLLYRINQNMNLKAGFSIGLFDIYLRKRTESTLSEGGANIFLKNYFLGIEHMF